VGIERATSLVTSLRLYLCATDPLRLVTVCVWFWFISANAGLNSFPLGELEETTGTPPYYVDEDYPAGPGIIEPLPE